MLLRKLSRPQRRRNDLPFTLPFFLGEKTRDGDPQQPYSLFAINQP